MGTTVDSPMHRQCSNIYIYLVIHKNGLKVASKETKLEKAHGTVASSQS